MAYSEDFEVILKAFYPELYRLLVEKVRPHLSAAEWSKLIRLLEDMYDDAWDEGYKRCEDRYTD